MTDPVKGVIEAQATSAGGSYSGGSFSGQRKKSHHESGEDLIEISPDARKRLQGNKKKSLLEYLKELLD